MKHFIIGTAGHVDHGKTSLIKAMTGIDTDRLKEEKKRGITIDLGFAYMDLPHFCNVGIVDVPGHEKFIRNMLAGAGGIDMAILVVAADEGVMPQTREHLDILSVLGMGRGLVVITKTDLAEPGFIEMVEEDILDAVEGTFLENAPVLKVSSHTGEGIGPLKACLDRQLMELAQKDEKKPFRLPIDRAFTMTGFGTVVTGTVIEGTVNLEQECMLYPDMIPVKIRGIQIHSSASETACAGQRAAVNLSAIPKEAIRRGHVLAPSGSLTPAMFLDVRLDVLKDSAYSVKNNSRVHFHHGSAELVAKVILMDRDILNPGNSCYAQLRFTEPVVAKKGDRFVIRFYSPLVTVGGGMVLDSAPVKKRRNQEEVCLGMEIKERGSDRDQLLQTIKENFRPFHTLQELIRKGDLNRHTAKQSRSLLLSEGRIVELEGGVYLAKEREEAFREHIILTLKEFHRENPLKEGMPLQEFRLKLLGNGREKDADALLGYWIGQKVLKDKDGCVSLYNFRIQKQEDETIVAQGLERIYRDAAFALPVLEHVTGLYKGNRRFNAVLGMMLKEGVLIKLDQRYLIHREWYETARQKLMEAGRDRQEITLGQYRDCLDASRKIALALLEYFDRQGLTRKNGDVRVLSRTGEKI
ncbi:selenocysteine-specific translation elongation factor [Enterocloster aldenensis]|uniref:selenocysteine-specific translation elongation factor n=1 Tax=Enterocloster aldenensis TaxID=358742 RepID=UPI000E533811|nr:selenocysteine-specific translation elongation factor [Enterocloster aldenensis]